eukprot:CAMPEP_0206481906 /NCGR_PEP_ID=MMETSP0324_2-20121206/38486_1 /ASSEMBLY_ACC=CAM_ASM_000836 /TAXON_ID=2866 /ORGANISM="Crypthecodinium cohnii, Strain Seligo" /LENGTH=170 /DNA_ID=CAMNT_0053959609 /DNA_START=57 /DNA_END=566 /DNA_ORIENTATION=+
MMKFVACTLFAVVVSSDDNIGVVEPEVTATNAELDTLNEADIKCQGAENPFACWLKFNMMKSASAESGEDSVVHAEDACSAGYVKSLRDAAPDCINSCTGSCYDLGQAIHQYLAAGGQPAAKRYVCRHTSSFSCFVAPGTIGKCQGLISSAARYGFHIPNSQSALYSTCR